MRRDKASITIQKYLRQKLCRQHFLHVRNSAIVVQSLYRSKIATTLVRTLLYDRKEEAKLVNQVAELKRQLVEQSDVANTTSIELVERLKKENMQLRTENEKLSTAKMELESQVRALTAKLINERSVSAATRAETVRKKKRRALSFDLEEERGGMGVERGGGGGGGGGGEQEEQEQEQHSPTRGRRKRFSSSSDRLRGLIDRGLSKVKKTPLRKVGRENSGGGNGGGSGSGGGPPPPVSARRGVETPSHNTPDSTSSSSSNPRRRSWLRRMFSGNGDDNDDSGGVRVQTTPGGSGSGSGRKQHFPLPSSSSSSSSSSRSSPSTGAISLQRRSGRAWVTLKHDEWLSGKATPFYVHLRLITGGYVGMTSKRVAERMVPVDGWSSNFVFVATPLTMPSKENPNQEERLCALRYSLSQTHLAPQSFFMGWTKKLGAHTDQGELFLHLCFNYHKMFICL